MNTLWQRFKSVWRRSEQRRDEHAIEDAQRAHQEAEREKQKEPALPPGRTNTDWTYIPPP